MYGIIFRFGFHLRWFAPRWASFDGDRPEVLQNSKTKSAQLFVFEMCSMVHVLYGLRGISKDGTQICD